MKLQLRIKSEAKEGGFSFAKGVVGVARTLETKLKLKL